MFLLREYKAYHSAYHLQKFLLNTQGLKVVNSLVVLFSLVYIFLSYRVRPTINISSEQQKIVHCCSKGLLVYLMLYLNFTMTCKAVCSAIFNKTTSPYIFVL